MSKKSEDNNNLANPQGKSFEVKQIHFETIGSTNTWAKENTDQWLPNGLTVISASMQTAGRGRFKREWHSPACVNLYVTFCFWLTDRHHEIGFIPQLLALAAVKVLEDHHFQPKIKWPNDVLINDKKVAGILCETVSEENRRGVICGIGLNVNMSIEDILKIDRPATSMLAESTIFFDLQMIGQQLQIQFKNDLLSWFQDGFENFFLQLVTHSAYQKGDYVCFHDNLKWIDAHFEQLNLDGSVQLRLTDGSSKKFYAGEFSFKPIQ